MTGESAAESRAYVAERQIDLVMDDQDTLEWHLQRAACRADGASHVVHVGLWPEQGNSMPRARTRSIEFCGCAALRSTQPAVARDFNASGRRTPLDHAATKAVLRTRQSPARGQLVGHHEADVMTGVGVLATRIAQPNDQPVDWRAATEGAQKLLLGGSAAVARGRLVTAGLADELGLGFDLGLLLGL